MNPATLDENQSRLLGSLTLATVRRLGGDTVCVDQDNHFPHLADGARSRANRSGRRRDRGAGRDRKGGPVRVADAKPKPGIPPEPKHRVVGPAPRESRKSGTGQGSRDRPSQRAQALVREQLADGTKRGEDVQAAAHLADISERLRKAAGSRGARTRKSQWWLPTVPARTDWTRSGSYVCAAAAGADRWRPQHLMVGR